MNRRRRIYEGKANILYEGPEPGTLVQHFKDDATAFDGIKRGTIVSKGVINNRMSALLFTMLEKKGIPTHYVETLSDRAMLVKKLDIIPVEVIVRNIAAGSLVKNLGLKFSGGKGFHILVPWKAFPKFLSGNQTKDLFPEVPRKLVNPVIPPNLPAPGNIISKNPNNKALAAN